MSIPSDVAPDAQEYFTVFWMILFSALLDLVPGSGFGSVATMDVEAHGYEPVLRVLTTSAATFGAAGILCYLAGWRRGACLRFIGAGLTLVVLLFYASKFLLDGDYLTVGFSPCAAASVFIFRTLIKCGTAVRRRGGA